MAADDNSGSLRRVWPTGTDYARAIQTPATSFSDPALAAGKPGVNAMGMPLVASGQNAVVFLVQTNQGAQAVRCFLTPPHEGAVRYEALQNHLKDTAPRALTAARWLPNGVSVGGENWPVVVMPWVEGRPLNIAVEDMLDEPDALRSLAVQWSEVVRSLQRAKVAHGDLQHGNVLVRQNGSVALVDLDGIWVPEIEVGPPAEFGHPNYQHPSRSSQHWGQYVDSFPGCLIELALNALAVDPSLGRFLYGENLLFMRSDLERSEDSQVWDAVCASTDPQVAALAAHLRRRCQGDIAEVLVPFDALRDVAADDRTVVRSAEVEAPAAVALAAPVAAPTPAPVAPAQEEWWQQPGAAPAGATAARSASPASSTSSTSPLVWLGKNLTIAGIIGGAIAGVFGSEFTTFFDAALDERAETAAFVVLITVLLGGLLQSMQSIAAQAWGAAARRFAIGGAIGGIAGIVALPIADALVKAMAQKERVAKVVSESTQYEVVTTVPFMANVVMFMVVAVLVALALGLLRSVRTAMYAAGAGLVGGGVGGAIFGATVASWRGTALDVKFLEPGTMAIVGVVCASIGGSYGAAVRARRLASLTVIEGANKGLEISVEGTRATIGSASSSDLVMRGDGRVLPTHAVVWLDASPPEVEAVGELQRNGAPVVGRVPLANNDVVMVGGSFVRIEFKEQS